MLATADQNTVESLALKLLAAPELVQQKEESRQLFLAEPAATTPDGRKTLQRALDDMTYMAALGAANNHDPAHPKVTWLANAGHSLFGQKVPGSGVAFDNPDTIYSLITVDGASRYEVTVRIPQAAPPMFSFYLYDAILGNSSKRSFDMALAGFREREIKLDAEGSFKITVDSDPANGRPNHMQSQTDARCIFIRKVKLVKLAELPALLPAETTKVTPAQREQFLRHRALTYARRL